MLSEKEYKEVVFSILESSDPLLVILNTDRDLLSDNPELWDSIDQLLHSLHNDGGLANELLSKLGPIQKTIKAFKDSRRDFDDKIPAELFKLEHLFLFHTKGEQVEIPKDKIPVRLCCGFTLEIMEGLRQFEPTKVEFDFFKSSFYKHKTAADYKNDLEACNSGTLEKIFQRTKALSPEMKEYYLTQIRAEILNQLREQTDMQIDFQLAFDELMNAENKIESFTRQNSGIRLNRSKQGAKTDLLRILDALYDLRFFNDDEGQLPTKEFVMQAFGEFLGDDFSAFANSLSQSYNNTSLEANLSIFEQLKAKIQEKHLSKR